MYETAPDSSGNELTNRTKTTETKLMTKIDYDKLTDDEAIDILKADFGSRLIEDRQTEIISAPDVLYYADAYGEYDAIHSTLETAILLQSWDKSLSHEVHRGLVESGLDIYEAVNNHDLETQTCPSCDTDMWEFQIQHTDTYTETHWVDDYGHVTEWFTFVQQPENRIWNANPDKTHAPVLCQCCSHDASYMFPRQASESGSVRIHYAETDEISGFSVSNTGGNLIRWDFDSYFGDTMTDLYPLPGNDEDLPKAISSARLTEWLDEHNWTEIALDTVKNHGTIRHRFGSLTTKRQYKQIAEDWAESDETHPDLDFTYVVDFASFGTPSYFCHEDNEDALLAEIVDLIERRV